MGLEIKKKMLLLGDGAVGKTSLVRRFVLDQFDDRYITTIGAKVTKKEIKFKAGGQPVTLTLMLWDLLGQQGYERIQKASFAGADGALMVCDVTRRETLKSLDTYWLPMLREVAGAVPIIILANKADLPNREITPKELFEMAGKHHTNFFFTSAKTGLNVNLAFYKLGYYVLKKHTSTATKEVELAAEEEKKYLPQIEEKEWYTPIEVADMIMTDFCAYDEVAGIDGTMEILVPQFDRAGVDVKNPTKDGLKKVVKYLAEMEILIKEPDEVQENYERRMRWVEKIKE